MSYGGKGVGGVLDEIASDPSVREVQEARFWQAHHGLCIATVKVVVLKGIEEGKLREKVGRLVRERLGSGNGGDRKSVV